MIKTGDIVELLGTDNRNRQLRSQEKKRFWTVIKIGTPQCFFGKEGFLIQHVSGHDRWVIADDIQITLNREDYLNDV